MDRDVGTQFLDVWAELVPKILEVAKDDESIGISTFFGTYSRDEISDGITISL